ncbi:MAG: CBS domain-containing protein [Bacilli bacterium]|nr:CBS domain-containing protein [Bacilli bacterium]MDD4283066.1 CBS domain-containing protein [Bacilli bacterium]MDD4718485.1 CBS domain-containing protein [Bacilli bacterium]
MSLESIMSKDLVIGKHDDNLSDIAKLMREYDIGFIPISKENRIIGVITDRDIVINSLSNKETNCGIESYMTRNLISLDINETIETAINIMGEQKVKRLLIKDNGYLAGIVSISDIINTDIDAQLIINNLKKMWEITLNSDRMTPKVNEFKL